MRFIFHLNTSNSLFNLFHKVNEGERCGGWVKWILHLILDGKSDCLMDQKPQGIFAQHFFLFLPFISFVIKVNTGAQCVWRSNCVLLTTISFLPISTSSKVFYATISALRYSSTPKCGWRCFRNLMAVVCYDQTCIIFFYTYFLILFYTFLQFIMVWLVMILDLVKYLNEKV